MTGLDTAVAQPARSRRNHWMNHLERHAYARGCDTALRFDDRTTTWADLHGRVSALAGALARRGVSFGDRVAIIMGNRPEVLETMLATNLLGAIAVPLNFRFTGPEGAYVLTDSGAAVVVVDGFGLPVIDAALPLVDRAPQVVSTAGGSKEFEDYESLIAENDSGAPTPTVLPDVPEDSPAFIMYTSGTTGRPKGAVLTHSNLQAQALTILRCTSPLATDVNLISPPLFHIGALGSAVPYILIGATNVIMQTGAFSPEVLLDLLEAEQVTAVFMVPTQWQAVCNSPSVSSRKLDRLRIMSWGAAPASDTLLRLMSDTFPDATNVAMFGQTEMSPVTCVLSGVDSIRKLGSVGKPVETVIARIVDADMVDVAPGEVGEIVYRGPGLMREYWNNPQATADAFHGGWFHSGDLVRADDEGFVYIVDRAKDMIISGGENIYCAEVENVLAGHPLVSEVTIIGRPHDVWGESPVAYVVVRSAQQRDQLTLELLREWASVRLAKFKLPTQLEIVDALPRNASGKVLKHVLRQPS